MNLFQLFLAFLQIGSFSIGGGYATIPLIQSIVISHGWLTIQEFSDIITISQMTPGPLAVNTSTFVGIRIAGLSGAVVATLGCILVGVLLNILLIRIFHCYASHASMKLSLLALRASSCGLILSACFILAKSTLTSSSTSFIPICFICISFIILRKYKMNPIYLIAISGSFGVLLYHS